jgi:predicted alpha/beta-hydrolase family hydrolase
MNGQGRCCSIVTDAPPSTGYDLRFSRAVPSVDPSSGPSTLTFILENGPQNANCRLVVAHGAGAGIESPFLETIADLIAQHGIAVTRFEFDYMASRRAGGSKRPPPRADALASEYREMVRSAARRRPKTLLIGGKSLGGRVASLIADELHDQGDVAGLVCFGYPFHPPGKPDQLRTQHLETLQCPALIVQGERDPFGNRAEVEALALSKKITFAWIGDGDHDFGPRGGSSFTRKGNLAAAADAVAAFAAQFASAR